MFLTHGHMLQRCKCCNCWLTTTFDTVPHLEQQPAILCICPVLSTASSHEGLADQLPIVVQRLTGITLSQSTLSKTPASINTTDMRWCYNAALIAAAAGWTSSELMQGCQNLCGIQRDPAYAACTGAAHNNMRSMGADSGLPDCLLSDAGGWHAHGL